MDGKKLGTYGGSLSGAVHTNVYFAGKLIWAEGGGVILDRLGSSRGGTNYFPYGEEYSTTGRDVTKFATYFRDETTALDYANQRYYGPTIGRFLTVDPHGGSARPGNPQTWNRYSYALNDPVNFTDKTGLQESGDGSCFVDGWLTTPGFCRLLLRADTVYYEGMYPAELAWTGLQRQEERAEGQAERQAQQEDRALLPAATSRAIQALTLNTNCMELFGNEMTRKGKFNPVNVLWSLVTGSGFGRIKFEDKGSDWGVAKTSPAGFILPRLWSPFVSSNKVTITINSYNDASHSYWNDADPIGNAATLLHELGHAFNFLRGSGGSRLANVGEIFDGTKNDEIIKKNCFPTL